MNEILIAEQSQVEDVTVGSFLTSMEMLRVLNEEKHSRKFASKPTISIFRLELSDEIFMGTNWDMIFS